MKTSKITLQAVAILLSLALLPESSRAQVFLSGLLQQGANSQTGGSDDSPIFTTAGVSETGDFAVIYLTQPNAGYTAPFVNPGTPNIDYALTSGTYQFYFWTVSFFGNAPGYPNNPGTYGLNLFFDGNNTIPGIAAFSPQNTLTATPVQVGQTTLSLDGYGNNEVPVSGSLTYVGDGLSVTLTDYGYGEPGVFGGPALDLVSATDSEPDGYASAVGVFDLTVAPVPEPSSVTFFIVTVFFLLIFKTCAATQLNHTP